MIENLHFTACFYSVTDTFRVNQVAAEWGFTLKRVRDMIRIYSQMHRKDKFSQHSSTREFKLGSLTEELSVLLRTICCGFESSCSHLNFPECLGTFPEMFGDIPRNITFSLLPAFPTFCFPFLYTWFCT